MTVKEAISTVKRLISDYEKQIRFTEDLLRKAKRNENFEEAELLKKELEIHQKARIEALEMLKLYQNISDN